MILVAYVKLSLVIPIILLHFAANNWNRINIYEQNTALIAVSGTAVWTWTQLGTCWWREKTQASSYSWTWTANRWEVVYHLCYCVYNGNGNWMNEKWFAIPIFNITPWLKKKEDVINMFSAYSVVANWGQIAQCISV